MIYKKTMIHEIADRFGTPLYLYDKSVMLEKYDTFKACFGNDVDIFYSLKANPNLSIAKIFCKKRCGVEVASRVELELALHAGYQPNNIIFVGPAKTASDIALALDAHIYAIICESVEEIELVNTMAKTRSMVACIAIRVNPLFSVRNASLKMGGVPSQFGMDYEELIEQGCALFQKKHINIIGIHVYNATRILDAESVAENCKQIILLADHFSKKWNQELTMIDMGGGIGVPYYDGEIDFNVKKFSILMKQILAKSKKIRLIFECGRYLVAEAGILVSRIRSVKQSRGKQYLIIDAGMHCHLMAAGYGSLIRKNFPIKLISHVDSTKRKKYQITGPSCTPADVIGRDAILPEASIADLIAIEMSGAYGPSASPTSFLSHGHPAEVLIDKDQYHLIRYRDTAKDFIQKQHVIS